MFFLSAGCRLWLGTNFPCFCCLSKSSCLNRCSLLQSVLRVASVSRFSKETDQRGHVTDQRTATATKRQSLKCNSRQISTRAGGPAGATGRATEKSPSRSRELASLSPASRRTSNDSCGRGWPMMARGPLRRFPPRLQLGEKFNLLLAFSSKKKICCLPVAFALGEAGESGRFAGPFRGLFSNHLAYRTDRLLGGSGSFSSSPHGHSLQRGRYAMI